MLIYDLRTTYCFRVRGHSSFRKVNTIKLGTFLSYMAAKRLGFVDSHQTLRTTQSDDGLGPESEMSVERDSPRVSGSGVTHT